MKNIIKSKLFKQVVSLCLLLVFLFTTFTITNAEFHQSGAWKSVIGNPNQVFFNASYGPDYLGNLNEPPIKPDPEYGNDISYSQIGFDILYGKSRGILEYVGEVPAEGDHSAPVNPLADNSIYESYWGKGTPNIDSEEVKNITKLQEWFDKSEQNSLRLLALDNTNGATGIAPVKWLYAGAKGITMFVSNILSFFIQLKNMDISTLFKTLGVEGLLDLFIRIFVWEKNDDGTFASVSVFLIFSLIGFILAVIHHVISYIKGGNKKNSLFSILILGIVGFMVINFASSPNATDIGTKMANLAQTLAEDVLVDNGSSNTDIFLTQETERVVGDTKLDIASSTINYNEVSKLNKLLIDAQIKVQFGVDDMLDLNNFNVKDTKIKSFVPGVSSSSDETSINLGYAFWLANTGAKDFNITNKTYSYVGKSQCEQNLTDYITGLQQLYDKSDTTDTQKQTIRNMILHLASPDAASGIVTFLLIGVLFVFLVLALWMLVWKVLFAKIVVAGGILAFPIAGPLFISNKESLVQKAKFLCFLTVSYTIQILVYSVIFDLIITIIGIIITSNGNTLTNVLIALVLTFALKKMMPTFVGYVEKLCNSIDEAIGGKEMTSMKRQVSSAAAGALGRFNSWNDNRTRYQTVIGSDGKPQRVAVGTHKGGLTSTLGHLAANSLADPRNRRSNDKIFKDARIARKHNTQEALKKASELTNTSEDKLNNYNTKKDNINNEQFNGKMDSKNDSELIDNVNVDKIEDKNVANNVKQIKGLKKSVESRKQSIEDAKNKKQELIDERSNFDKTYGDAYGRALEVMRKQHRKMTDEEKWAYNNYNQGMKMLNDKIKNEDDRISKANSQIAFEENKIKSLETSTASVLRDSAMKQLLPFKEDFMKSLESDILLKSQLLERGNIKDPARWQEVANLQKQLQMLEKNDLAGLNKQVASEREVLQLMNNEGYIKLADKSRLASLNAEEGIKEIDNHEWEIRNNKTKIKIKEDEAARAKAAAEELAKKPALDRISEYADSEVSSSLKVRDTGKMTVLETTAASRDIAAQDVINASVATGARPKPSELSGLSVDHKSVFTDQGRATFNNTIDSYAPIANSDIFKSTPIEYKFDENMSQQLVTSLASSEQVADMLKSYAQNGGTLMNTASDIANMTYASGEKVFTDKEQVKAIVQELNSISKIATQTSSASATSTPFEPQKVVEVEKRVEVEKQVAPQPAEPVVENPFEQPTKGSGKGRLRGLDALKELKQQEQNNKKQRAIAEYEEYKERYFKYVSDGDMKMQDALKYIEQYEKDHKDELM